MKGRKDTRTRASAITGEVMSEIFRQKDRATVVERADDVKKGAGAVQEVVLILSMLGCLILTGLNVTGKMPFQAAAAAPSADAAQQMAQQTLNFAVRAIDAYHREYGRLPVTLTEVGAPMDPRWSYEVIGSERYRVEFRAAGFSLAYDSISDADEFFAGVRRHR